MSLNLLTIIIFVRTMIRGLNSHVILPYVGATPGNQNLILNIAGLSCLEAWKVNFISA
jgi:hypothetical protein